MRIAILGAGDLGRTLAHHARAVAGIQIVGFFDDTRSPGTVVAGGPVLGGIDDVLPNLRDQQFEALLMGIGYKHLLFRQRLFERMREQGVPFATVVHPSCYVDRSATVGSGAVLFPGCVVDAEARVGENSVLNTACVVAHDSIVGAHTFLGPGVHLAGFVRTGSRCFLGIGTVVIDRVTIGDNTQTGGGTVVTKSCEGGVLLVGAPARVVRELNETSG